jgi:acyl dehydratase
MAVDTSVIGKPTGASKVTVERGAVSAFAAGVTDDNPIYRDAAAARAAGFRNVPAPPTYTFGMRHAGAFADDQPPDPTGGENPMHVIMGELHAKGALVLHGEQEFEYHRPVEVGDVLTGESRIVDVYEKDTDAATMTFIVMATEWQDPTGAPVVTERFNLIARLKK